MIGLGSSVNSRLSHCAFPEASSALTALPAMADATKAALVCKNVRRLSQAIACSFHNRGRRSGELDLVPYCRQCEIRSVATRHHEATGGSAQVFHADGTIEEAPALRPSEIVATCTCSRGQIRCCSLAASLSP